MESITGFITTIGDEDVVDVARESTDSEDEEMQVHITKKKKTKKKNKTSGQNKDGDFDDGFEFEDEEYGELFEAETLVTEAGPSSAPTSLDEKIASVRRRNKQMKTGTAMEEDEELPLGPEEAVGVVSSSEEEEGQKTDTLRVKGKQKKKKKGKGRKGKVDNVEEEEKIKFSEEVNDYNKEIGFADMNLSRPLLKALTEMNFDRPTAIQAATIPVALLGKDICACAATGTGKTAAFMLPILERLLYKPMKAPATRVLILTPTRELAVQIYQVAARLAQFTSVTVTLAAGGLSMKTQEAALRLSPDIVVATPGRLIDHLHNAPCFHLDGVEILILDEADRMLDEYFAEQMSEVIRLCARQRQTMLFSATMTEQVRDLAAVSLNDPVKVFVNESTDVAFGLRQEFVRIRPNSEGDREAIVSALVKRTFHDRCIVFIQTKKQAHRMHIILGLLGVRVGELHGNLSQLQRLDSLKKFKDCEIDVLLATDLAARGLDIPDVKTVINFTMPNTLQHYIHRVGRTARAGKGGRSVTLAGEKERKQLKEVVKKARNPVKSRVVPQEVVSSYRTRISRLEDEVVSIGREERAERDLRSAEVGVSRAERLINLTRPANGLQEAPPLRRVWFQTQTERANEQAALRLVEFSQPTNKRGKKKVVPADARIVLTAEDRVEHEMTKSAAYAARASKRQMKPKRARVFDEDDGRPAPKKSKKAKKPPSSFEKELTSTSSKALKKFRAGPSYEEKKELGMLRKKGGQSKSRGGKPQNRYKRR